MRKQDKSPQESMADTLVFSSRDWGAAPDLAWIWGVVNGWSDESMREFCNNFSWSSDDVVLLKVLHQRFEDLREIPPK